MVDVDLEAFFASSRSAEATPSRVRPLASTARIRCSHRRSARRRVRASPAPCRLRRAARSRATARADRLAASRRAVVPFHQHPVRHDAGVASKALVTMKDRIRDITKRTHLAEPPDADPHVRWCGRELRATPVSPFPIAGFGRLFGGLLFRGQRVFDPVLVRIMGKVLAESGRADPACSCASVGRFHSFTDTCATSQVIEIARFAWCCETHLAHSAQLALPLQLPPTEDLLGRMLEGWRKNS